MKIQIFSATKFPLKEKLVSINSSFEICESHYEDLAFVLPNTTPDDIRLLVADRDIREFDFIFFRRAQNFQKYTTTIAHYLKYHNIPSIDSYNLNCVADEKLLQMMLFQLNNIPTPNTIVFTPLRLRDSFDMVTKMIGSRFIMKESQASHGNLNFLITDEEAFNKVILDNPDSLFLCQEFIPNDFDYRLVTLGYKVKVIKKRTRTNTASHLNNRSQGATVEFVSKDGLTEIIEIAEKAARLFKTEVAGVDIIIDCKTGKPYVLEVNRAPDVLDEPTMKALASYLASTTNLP